jgi:CheY-like chemotaxis protein
VLLDFMMPQLTGAEVARTIREDPQLAETPVVLFSCVDESEVDWRGSGADLFLQKPMDMRRLPEMIDRLTGQEKRAA